MGGNYQHLAVANFFTLINMFSAAVLWTLWKTRNNIHFRKCRYLANAVVHATNMVAVMPSKQGGTRANLDGYVGNKVPGRSLDPKMLLGDFVGDATHGGSSFVM